MLAHGAGTAMDTPFMATVAEGVAAARIRVLRFEFPYMSKRSRINERRPPDPEPILLDCWRTAFAAAGKPERLRTEHLKTLKTKALFLQGKRDPFGMPQEIKTYHLSKAVRIHWITDGNHDLNPGKKSGRTLEQNMAGAFAIEQKPCLKVD